MSSRTRNADPAEPRGEETDLFDYALIGQWVGFAFRSLRRHPWVATTCVLVMGLIAAAVLVLFPKTYRVQTVIQALRNPSLPTLANAGLYRPYEADAPTRAAKETVLRRDNLVALIKQTDLIHKAQSSRAPVSRWRDDVVRWLRGRDPTQDELTEMLVELLEKRLTVEVNEGTVTIAVNWGNATAAYDLIETASQNFLETRHTTEIAMVSDAIAILETHAAHLQQQIDDAVEKLQAKDRAQRRTNAPASRRAATTPGASPDVIRLENAIASKRRAIADLEDFRQKRLAELQAQLLQYQGLYADRHPAVVSLRQNIEALGQPSPQLDTLKAEVAELERDLMGRRERGEVPLNLTLPRDETTLDLRPLGENDPREEYERTQVRMLFQNYGSVVDRIDAARVEMDAAQAAFKYRYSVISPPQMPKRPVKPAPAMVLLSSLLGSFFLAMATAVLLDLRSGVFLERWQLERELELPVLGDLSR